MKESSGILLVRKMYILHMQIILDVIVCEILSIYRLSNSGINLGDYVTISRGEMIRSSSYYGIDIGFLT